MRSPSSPSIRRSSSWWPISPVRRSRIGCACRTRRSSASALRMRSSQLTRAAHAIGPRDVARDDREAVAAGLLRVVHREVGGDEQLLAGDVAGAKRRDADARRHAAPALGRSDGRLVADRAHEVGRDALRARLVDVRQEHGELVAAEPGEDVRLAQPAAQRRRDRQDELVAGVVAERVVDVLEVVEVEHEQRAARPVAGDLRRPGGRAPARSGGGCRGRSAGRGRRGGAARARSAGAR